MPEVDLLLLNVTRQLRYRTLTPMIGQTVTISGRTLVATEATAFVNRFADGCCFAGPGQNFLDGQIAKYGILDLHFDAPATMLDTDASGSVPLLRDLGFIDNGIEDLIEKKTGDVGYCLKVLHEGIAEDKAHLLLFLESTDPDLLQMSVMDRMRRIQDPSIICFPVTFKVVDACITNSLDVWMNKHFYL